MLSLADLHTRLSRVHDSIQRFEIPISQPPVIDLSFVHEKHVLPGLRFLREEVKRDCEVLQKFLWENPNSSALSTNAPYLIAAWDELVHARQPIAVYRMFSLTEGQSDARKKGPQGNKSSRIQTRTVKVDIVAENGAKWVRVNTIKNSRLMMEFREIDSYLTSDEDEDEPRPQFAEAECDNSVLRMGRDLLAAAKANPISIHTSSSGLLSDSESVTRNPDDVMIPRVTIRLTRLNPLEDGALNPRVELTIQRLREMGIDVQLGERSDPYSPPILATATKQQLLEPTTNINLDLSALIALTSDISHSPLPQTEEEAHARFVPPQNYLDWKKERTKLLARSTQTTGPFPHDAEDGDEDTAEVSGQHSRALATQAIQEMNKGTLEEIHECLSAVVRDSSSLSSRVRFWTTSEARHRCLQIVSKIGGKRERQRADALLDSTLCSRMSPVPTPADTPLNDKVLETIPGRRDTEITAADMYWEHSRFSARFLPLTPVHIYPSILPTPNEELRSGTSFFDALARTCSGILSHEVIPISQVSVSLDPSTTIKEVLVEIPPATKTLLPKLTEHTIRSMLAGAARKYTTLTTNRSSVKAVLKEMRSACGNGGYEGRMGDIGKAALWVLDPRSLSEGMRSE